MKNTQKSKGKTIVAKAPEVGIDNNIAYYQYFFISLIFLILLVDVLFQNGATNILIKRSWGINNFSYFPWWLQAFVFTLLFAIAVPSVNNFFRLFIQQLTTKGDKKNSGESKKTGWFIGISMGITLLFYLFKVKYDLLGDMNLRISQSVQGQYIDDEFLVMYFMHYLNIILHNLFNISPHQTFVLASLAGGFFYSFLGLLIADLLFKDIFSVVIFFLFYISIGNILIFCGYTEIYALPAASASLYMYTALLYLKKRVSIIIPFLCMVLAVALHKEQVSVLPSLIFLATRKITFINKLNVKTILILFIISLPLIYILNTIFHLQSLMFLTKDKNFPQVNTIFSFSYWWELFNSQYISSGILLFLFVAILFKAVKGQIKLDDYSKFLLITVLFIYSIVITMNKERGSGDWDVCSFPAIYLSMFVAYIALTQWKAIYSPKKLFYIVSTALLLNSFSCWAWIGLNSGKKSLDKIEDMLLTDPGWFYQERVPADIELSLIFEKYGTQDKALQYYKLSYDTYKKQYLISVLNYASILISKKDTDKVIPVCEDAIALYPNSLTCYEDLYLIYQRRKQYDKFYNLAKSVGSLYDSNPDLVLGTANSKNLIILCNRFLYQNALGKGDTAIYNQAVIRMKQLNTH